MIWSVSTSARSSTETRALDDLVHGLHLRLPLADVDEVALDRRGRGHLRARRGGCARPGPGGPRSCGCEVDAQRSPGGRMSGFMPRHIEQPALRQSKPAARNTSSRPSASACAFTCCEPGTTIALHARLATLLPVDHRGGGAQVADARVGARADEHAVELDLLDRRARPRGPCSTSARSSPSRRCGSGTAPGDRRHHLGRRAPGDLRRQRRRRRPRPPCRSRALVGAAARATRRGTASRRRPGGPRATRRWSRRARSCPRGRRPRSSCCRRSCGPPSRAPRSPRRRTRPRGRRRRPRPSGRSCRGSGPWR